eukprot:scaffold449_cov241-Pinguiococcus_pyrenoidosus.AAC.7
MPRGLGEHGIVHVRVRHSLHVGVVDLAVPDQQKPYHERHSIRRPRLSFSPKIAPHLPPISDTFPLRVSFDLPTPDPRPSEDPDTESRRVLSEVQNQHRRIS